MMTVRKRRPLKDRKKHWYKRTPMGKVTLCGEEKSRGCFAKNMLDILCKKCQKFLGVHISG